MKTPTYISKSLFAGLSLMLLFAACSDVNNEVESLTDDDIELATQILTESVSDESSGIVSSLYDAVSTVSTDEIHYKSHAKSNPDDRSGRGRERKFSHTYDSETGTHTLSFERNVVKDDFSKNISLLNTYIYKSPEGEFIVQPKANRDSIESVNFTGNKSGSVNSRFRNSSFARIDTFALAGLHGTSGTISIDGTHHGEGSATGMTTDSLQASRNFTVDIEFINVEMDKAIIDANGNLEEGITGTLTYKIVTNKSLGDENDENVIEGTIELDGDGTALLRFKKITKVIRFSLKDGSRR